MEDQGIMALPMGGMQGPTAQPPAQLFDPAASAAFEQMRSQVSPKEFSSEILTAAEQVDPAAVRQLRQALSGLRLPQEIIDALQQIVEVILRDPQNYAAIRQDLLADEFPEDLLPEQFDPMFFGALRVALDQIEAEAGGQPVQSFAMGGIANLRPIAAAMQGMGRSGDTMLAHITPREAGILQALGGVGTINPRTGLREYGFWKSVKKAVTAPFKAVGNALKSVAKEVKRFAQSSVGKIITTVALGFFLGPAAASFLGVTSAAGVAAVGGFVGGFGSSILAGQNLKDSLKAGAIGGVTAGFTAGVTGGMGAFEAGSYSGPTTISGQWDRAVNAGKDLLGLQATEGATTVGGTAVDPYAELDARAGAAPSVPTTPTTAELATTPPTDLTVGKQALTYEPNFRMQAGGFDLAQNAGTTASDVTSGIGTVPNDTFIPGTLSVSGTPYASEAYGAIPPGTFPEAIQLPSTLDPAKLGGIPIEGATPSTLVSEIPGVAGAPVNAPFTPPGGTFDATGSVMPIDAPGTATAGFQQAPSVMDLYKQGDYLGAAKETFMPTSYTEAQLNQSPAFEVARAKGATYDQALKTASNAYNPSMLRTYGPAIAAGVGALGMAGGFSPKEEPPPDNANRLYGSQSGAQLLASSPQIYGTTPGGAATQYYSPGYMGYGLPTRQYYRPQIMFGQPQYRYGFAEGGIASLAKGGSTNFPRKTGPINGPGTGTSDSIPAMLSDGEFVFTAKAVRNMGKGSRRLGAKRMYALMKALEGK
jgi:hypothetical protein